MPRKLELKVLRRSTHALQHFKRNPELAIALGTNRDRWSSPQPLQLAKMAFRHKSILDAPKLIVRD
jgi:hypothetical protein